MNSAVFKLSAFAPEQFVRDGLPQVVFAGRSNVGKSSVINTLTSRKALARVGSAPGKTRSANYFLINGGFYFVDLPGYGYAKVSHSVKEAWAVLMESFFQSFDTISLGVLVADARHTPTGQDRDMAAYFQQTCLPWMVLANKADKLKKNALDGHLTDIRETLVLDQSVPLIPFSGETGLGKQQALAEILQRTGMGT